MIKVLRKSLSSILKEKKREEKKELEERRS